MQLIELSAITQHEMADILSYRKKHEKKNEVRTDIIEKNKNLIYSRTEQRMSHKVQQLEHA